MNEKMIAQLCMGCFLEEPQFIERCVVGQGNYVYIVTIQEHRYVIRCSLEYCAYKSTIYWLKKLALLEIPVPKVISNGKYDKYEYLILTYFEGEDIGLVYQQLSDDEKKRIAKDIVCIQNKVATFEVEDIEADWSWCTYLNDMLERAKTRISQNGHFDIEKVERIQGQMWKLSKYFEGVKPIAYLDDISSKNLLIHNGQISGIIDIDWMGIGDRLTYVALTNMALLDMEYDTDYVKYILDEMQVNSDEKQAFLFYTLMYCVDFMGERGMQFMDKKVEVNEQIINKLNRIYDSLWEEWTRDICSMRIAKWT